MNKATIETTGAGDTFMACVLNSILKYGLDGMDKQKLYDMLEFEDKEQHVVAAFF